MKKKQIKKLSLKDHIIYIFVYILLFPFGFSLPFIVLLRDGFLLDSVNVLAYSTGWGVLWCIPSMMIAFLAIAYFGWAEKQTVLVEQAIVSLFRKQKTRLMVLILVVLFLLFLFFSLFSPWCEFRADGLYTCNIFGVENEIGRIEDIDNVIWNFDSTYISNGRYGSVQVSLVCEICLKDDEKISFDRFELSNLLSIGTMLKEVPTEIVNDHLIDEWISDLDCDEITLNRLYEMFIK